ncbi:DNA polymerase III subunit gamma/tau [Halorhodospira abdelmalekii]|uniref:DNA polymerase III subunit gamma/tau n=1 Tax=Halorhodospira abdelmalekii TaxID=421629 RepID=UPI0019058D63|nr:DNA polymerase III subunit gamma/tau [Halorhodospira abdelmalekii]MBK1733808.1 DNA polymerase III subunit gamma/tau [Halorhodospira abdelmalekii]
MTYQALARKWRPRCFADVAGQEHVLRALSNALADGRIHHAYLLSGTRGIGKTTVARILAKCLNCEQGVTATPCEVCPSCRELNEGRFVDLIEVDAASRTRVEDTRELLDNVQYAPTRGRYKVYLIDEVHMLSGHSFNALLKTLEEPPDHVKFLLATTDPQKLPVTVLSRCLQFHLRRLPAPLIRERLLQIAAAEQVEVDAAAAARIARAADGSLRDALSLLDQALAYGEGAARDAEVAAMLGAMERSQVLEIIQALAAGEGERLIRSARDLAAHAADFDDVLAELIATFHHLALACHTPGVIPEDEPERDALLELATAIAAEDLQLYYQIGLNARRDLPYAPDPAIGFEMALLRMLAFRPAATPPRSAAPPSAASLPAASPAVSPDASSPASRSTASAVDSATSGSATADSVAESAARPAQGPAVEGAEASLERPVAGSVAGAAAAPSAKQWAEWVASHLDGLDHALASHCQWQGQDGHRLTLHLDPAHRYLLSDERRLRLQEALSAQLGEAIELRIVVAGAEQTPAQQAQARAAQRQQQAEAALASDRGLQGLQAVFGAQVRDIRPAADDPASSGKSE